MHPNVGIKKAKDVWSNLTLSDWLEVVHTMTKINLSQPAVVKFFGQPLRGSFAILSVCSSRHLAKGRKKISDVFFRIHLPFQGRGPGCYRPDVERLLFMGQAYGRKAEHVNLPCSLPNEVN